MALLRKALALGTIGAFGPVTLEMTVASKMLKVAAVLPGNITEQAGMQITYEGLVRVKKALEIETAYSEKAPQAGQLEAMSDYARRGYDLIFGVSENLTAAYTGGISVDGIRYLGVVTGGALATLEGCYLVLSQICLFSESMSAAKGFIVLAAIAHGRWNPIGVISCLFAVRDV